MGSFFAGVKAGTLGGVVYIGGLALFNVALLYGFKGQALDLISKYDPVSCPATNMTGLQSCFNSVVSYYVPYIAFIGFFVVLFFSAFFGWAYETFPGRSPVAKGEVIAAMVALGLVLGDLYGLALGATATLMLVVFFVLWTGVYGYLMARLYSRYTRTVRFEGAGRAVKVLVDGKDFTGRARTFAATSTHSVRAECDKGYSFKEWTVSGGVTVEDPRSFETVMEINGDGLLKAQGVRKP